MKTLSSIIFLLAALSFSTSLHAQTQGSKNNAPSLKVTSDDGSINLSWTTAREINSSYFLLESSEDGVHFTTLKSTSASGSTMFAKTYDDVENTSDSGLFYRVTLVDMNGNRSSSQTLSLSNLTVAAVTSK